MLRKLSSGSFCFRFRPGESADRPVNRITVGDSPPVLRQQITYTTRW